ncbi:hypothetical protein KUCAC02_000746, partial [Chaenocephalus aceratus]
PFCVAPLEERCACLLSPGRVIHLPRGLEAVTRNWRNHDSTELSAPQSPGEESDTAPR